jgi:hypothetical protein
LHEREGEGFAARREASDQVLNGLIREAFATWQGQEGLTAGQVRQTLTPFLILQAILINNPIYETSLPGIISVKALGADANPVAQEKLEEIKSLLVAEEPREGPSEPAAEAKARPLRELAIEELADRMLGFMEEATQEAGVERSRGEELAQEVWALWQEVKTRPERDSVLTDEVVVALNALVSALGVKALKVQVARTGD